MKKTLGISIGLALLLVIPASFAALGQPKGIASAPADETQGNTARVDTVNSKRESSRCSCIMGARGQSTALPTLSRFRVVQ
jgi:hypothetical protein